MHGHHLAATAKTHPASFAACGKEGHEDFIGNFNISLVD